MRYVDYILVVARNQTECVSDSIALLKHLEAGGHRASLAKLKFCQESVNHLGYILNDGCRFLSQERVNSIKDIVRPRNKTEMLSFLGLVKYCRNCIVEYAELRKATLKDSPKVIQWNELNDLSFWIGRIVLRLG